MTALLIFFFFYRNIAKHYKMSQLINLMPPSFKIKHTHYIYTYCI